MEQRCNLGTAFVSWMASGKLLDLSVHPSFFILIKETTFSLFEEQMYICL